MSYYVLNWYEKSTYRSACLFMYVWTSDEYHDHSGPIFNNYMSKITFVFVRKRWRIIIIANFLNLFLLKAHFMLSETFTFSAIVIILLCSKWEDGHPVFVQKHGPVQISELYIRVSAMQQYRFANKFKLSATSIGSVQNITYNESTYIWINLKGSGAVCCFAQRQWRRLCKFSSHKCWSVPANSFLLAWRHFLLVSDYLAY